MHSMNAEKYAIEISLTRLVLPLAERTVSTSLALRIFHYCFMLKFAQRICLGLLGAERILRIFQHTYSPSI